jgi:hypothetical protein
MTNTPPIPDQTRRDELAQRDAHHAHDHVNEFQRSLNEAAIKGADAALRSALLINGGAAVSVLAFIGGLAAQSRIKLDQLQAVAHSLALFAFGVAAAVVSMVFAYLTNLVAADIERSLVRLAQPPFIAPGKHTPSLGRVKTIFHITALSFGIASLVLFLYGVFNVKDAITHLREATPTPEPLMISLR